MRKRQQTIAGAVTALVLGLGLAACGGGGGQATGTGAAAPSGKPGAGKPPVTLGSKNFTEQFVLGQLYTQALEARGFKVTLKNNIGSSEIVDKALTSGRIDAYPEYTGVILSELAQQKKRPTSATQAYQAAKKFEQSRGFTLTQPTPFFNTDALAVLRDYAKRNQLKQVSDLKKLGSKVTLGGPPEFRTRFEGLIGLRQVYGLDQLKFKPLTIGQQYQALDGGQIQTADVFTTDGQLDSGRYKVLKDPQNVFGFQNVAMVVSGKVLKAEGPAFEQTINAVSAKLTTDAMRQMNAAADLDKNPPADVARKFLMANKLI